MVVSGRLMLLVIIALSTHNFSQELANSGHKCPENKSNNQRIIKNSSEIAAPKLVSQQLPDASVLKEPPGVNSSRLVFEVLIDERGKVECVEHLKGAEGNQHLIATYVDAIKKWVYQVPKDSNGQPVSCYQVVIVNFILTR